MTKRTKNIYQIPIKPKGLNDLFKKGLVLPPSNNGLIVLIKGRPGTGKTTLALQIACEASKQIMKADTASIFFSSEQSNEDISERLKSLDINIDSIDIKGANKNKTQEINDFPQPPAPPPEGNKRNALEVVTGMINREWKGVVKEKNDLLKRKNRFIRVMQEQHHHQLATYDKESELRHQMLLQEQEKSRSLEERLHSVDTVAPKRKELLSKAAKLHPFWNRSERNQILDELTSLELNPESVEEEGG